MKYPMKAIKRDRLHRACKFWGNAALAEMANVTEATIEKALQAGIPLPESDLAKIDLALRHVVFPE